MRRAEAEIERADLVLWLVAPDVRATRRRRSGRPLWTVGTKADLGAVPCRACAVGQRHGDRHRRACWRRLTAFAEAAAGAGPPALLSRERDLVALVAAQDALDRFLGEGATDEIAAEHLRQASLALERLLGRIDTEQVLDRLFASFCIGK